MITIAEKRDAIIMANKYPNALIIDVSYSSMRYIEYKVLNPYGMLNPFYPHGKIQVPFTDGYTGVSISAIWNSLKVFEDADVDVNLRNCVAHGLWTPQHFLDNGAYLWWIALKMYFCEDEIFLNSTE